MFTKTMDFPQFRGFSRTHGFIQKPRIFIKSKDFHQIQGSNPRIYIKSIAVLWNPCISINSRIPIKSMDFITSTDLQWIRGFSSNPWLPLNPWIVLNPWMSSNLWISSSPWQIRGFHQIHGLHQIHGFHQIQRFSSNPRDFIKFMDFVKFHGMDENPLIWWKSMDCDDNL